MVSSNINSFILRNYRSLLSNVDPFEVKLDTQQKEKRKELLAICQKIAWDINKNKRLNSSIRITVPLPKKKKVSLKKLFKLIRENTTLTLNKRYECNPFLVYQGLKMVIIFTLQNKHRSHELPIVYPDLDNLVRITFNALQGIIYENDKQIVSLSCCKRYGDYPNIIIEVNPEYAEHAYDLEIVNEN